jgi:hypothetical protein
MEVRAIFFRNEIQFFGSSDIVEDMPEIGDHKIKKECKRDPYTGPYQGLAGFNHMRIPAYN